MVEAWVEIRRQVCISGRVTGAGRALENAAVAITAAPDPFMTGMQSFQTQYGAIWQSRADRPDVRITAVDGHFHFLDLPDGPYTLTASLPGAGTSWGSADAKVSVKRKADGTVVVAVVEIGVPPTVIGGKVTAGGSAVALARVRVIGTQQQALTDAMGAYTIVGVEAGDRAIEVTAQGFKPASQNLTVKKAGTSASLDFSLSTA